MQTITKQIASSTRALLSRQSFQEWFRDQKAPPKSLILVNNSFVYRDKLQTTKSAFYPCVETDAAGKVLPSQIHIVSGFQMNADFKAIVPQAQNTLLLETSKTAAARELKLLGRVVFLLIGEISDNVVSKEAIGHSLFKEMVLDPTSKSELQVIADQITVRSIADEESLWSLLEKAHGQPLPPELLTPFANAIQKLRIKDHATLSLPSAATKSKSTLIDSWVTALESSIVEYRDVLKISKGMAGRQPDAFNSLLRIAYNFAGDAVHLIRLLTSICDLKPLIRWCTTDDWFQLSEAFKELPWSKLKGKPSLDIYQQTINGARNHAFHNLLAVDKTLQAEIAGTALGTVRLRLFSEYSRRSEEKFEYEDKVLVQILTDFTRAAEHSVSADFWTRNLKVMEATVALMVSVSETLKVLHRSRGPI